MKKIILLFTFAALLITSCIPSVHPLITEDIEIQFDEVVGLYEVDDEFWKFEKSPDKDRSVYVMKTGETRDDMFSRYYVHFGKLNNMIFADFYPIEPPDSEMGAPDFIAMHTFAKVELQDEKLSLRYSDMDELKKLFREGKVRLKHEKMENGDILITASSKQLQKFIAQHGSNNVFFGVDQELKRISSKIDAGE